MLLLSSLWRSNLVLTREQKESLLGVLRGVHSEVEWAPELAGLGNGESGKRGSEPTHYFKRCSCDLKATPVELTLFLKAPLLGSHYNTVARLQHATEKWAERGGMKWEGCGICGGRLVVDVRLFRTDPLVLTSHPEGVNVENVREVDLSI